MSILPHPLTILCVVHAGLRNEPGEATHGERNRESVHCPAPSGNSQTNLGHLLSSKQRVRYHLERPLRQHYVVRAEPAYADRRASLYAVVQLLLVIYRMRVACTPEYSPTGGRGHANPKRRGLANTQVLLEASVPHIRLTGESSTI